MGEPESSRETLSRLYTYNGDLKGTARAGAGLSKKKEAVFDYEREIGAYTWSVFSFIISVLMKHGHHQDKKYSLRRL